VCGYHLLRRSYNILYFLWLHNGFFFILRPIHYIKNCWVRLLSNYNIIYIYIYIYTIYKRLDTCLMFISRFSLWDKVTLLLLKLHFYGADVVEWCRAVDIMLSDWCSSVSMVRVQIWQLKYLILTLFGLIFRRIYNIEYLPSIISNFEIHWNRYIVWLSPA
jgi:hypothetical protein